MVLDIEAPGALEHYLRAHHYISPDEVVDCRPLSGGVSNRTVFVQRSHGEAWVVKQALEKLRVAVDWFSSPVRIHNEAAGLRELAHFLPPGAVPTLIFEDWESHLLAMSAVPEPHENWKSMLLRGQLADDHIRQFATLLGQLHRQSTEGAVHVADRFADCSFFEALRLEPYYAYTATQVPAAAPFFEHLIHATRNRRYCLVHGDYSPKNVLVYQGQLVLLDYEVIHWGDPAFDLGFSLTHLLSKAHHMPAQRANFVNAAKLYWRQYQAVIGDTPWSSNLENCVIHHTLACLLARVAGRSPLEYLSATERQHQQQAVITLLADIPSTIPLLIEYFMARLSS